MRSVEFQKERGSVWTPHPHHQLQPLAPFRCWLPLPLRHPGITARPPETSQYASPTGRTKVATAPSTERASVTASSAPSQPRPLCCPGVFKVTREPGKGCRLSGLLSPLSHPAGCWHWSHFSIPWGQQTAVPPPLEGGLGWKASCPGTHRPCFSPVCFIDFLAYGKSLPFLPGLLSIFLLC